MKYLQNAWYIAVRSDELSTNLFARRILDKPIVLFRKNNGEVAALEDKCPHRFVPLHLGRIVDDTIQCGYHGLQFDCTGKCVVAPFDSKIPTTARVTSFPVLERFGMVWIWMGSFEKADPGEIPDLSCMIDPQRTQVHGYAKIKCNYELVMDNLADLSHAYYVHGSFYTPQGLERTEHSVTEENGAVYSKFHFPDIEVPSLWNNYAGHTLSRIDRWSEMRWNAPSNLLLYAGVTPTGQPRSDGINLYGVHMLTPETPSTTHYYYCHCRGFQIDDSETTEQVKEWQRIAFQEEDKPMLEAQQASIGTVDNLLSLKPVLLSSDTGAVRIRRRLQEKIKAEIQSDLDLQKEAIL